MAYTVQTIIMNDRDNETQIVILIRINVGNLQSAREPLVQEAFTKIGERLLNAVLLLHSHDSRTFHIFPFEFLVCYAFLRYRLPMVGYHSYFVQLL